MTELKKVLMSRDGFTGSEADFEIEVMRELVSEGENPEDILYDYGLEPDYFLDLM